MAEIVNAIWRGGNAGLIDEIDKIMGADEWWVDGWVDTNYNIPTVYALFFASTITKYLIIIKYALASVS